MTRKDLSFGIRHRQPPLSVLSGHISGNQGGTAKQQPRPYRDGAFSFVNNICIYLGGKYYGKRMYNY